MGATREDVDRAYREAFGRAVAVLARALRDLDLAEEAVQEAFAVALVRWPADGLPDDPTAWILRVARNRAIDVLRRRRMGAEREVLAVALEQPPPAEDEPSPVPDERLELLFACAHPALAVEARLPLVLRLVAGLTVPEIARALLVPEPTVAQRLVRAKRRVRETGMPLGTPPAHLLPERLDGVLAAIYLLFNEGYAATAGDDAIRGELCDEAIRLARLVVATMPDEAEAAGLLGLLLATDARRDARLDAAGRYVPLEHHDRGRYRRARLGEADALVRRALAAGAGPYALQGAIAMVHSAAPAFAETDWPQIVALYDALLARTPSPVVALNRALAVGWVEGPDAALALVDALAIELDAFAPLHAARGDLLLRLGRRAEAHRALVRALALTTNPAEREHLAGLLA